MSNLPKRLHTPVALVLSALVSSAAYSQQPAPGTSPPAPAAAAPTAGQSSLSSSLGVFVFPAKNQTATQQSNDEGACYGWAKSQTGIDPMNIKPPQPSQPSQAPQQAANAGAGAPVKGAVGGAALGAAGGAIGGKAGKGAALGAATGVVAGGVSKRRAQKEAAQQQQQEQSAADQQAQAAIAQQKATYNKAFSACMEGKGYTVK